MTTAITPAQLFKTDPIQLEIFRNKFRSIAEEMANVVQRTASTIFVVETADFTTSLATPKGEFFGVPLKLAITTYVSLDCSGLIKAVNPWEKGDIVITNDPYTTEAAVTQATDITVMKPVFYDDELIAFIYSFAHCTDVGGKVPGSISPTNWDIYQEGIRIQPTKLYKRGELNREFLDHYLANVRAPDDNWGDLKALVSALNTGEVRLLEMIERYGLAAVKQGMDDVLEYAALKAEQALEQIPDGSYEFVDYLDDDIVTPIPLRLSLKLQVDGGRVTMDWRKSDPQTRAAFNIPTAGKRHPWLTYRTSSFAYSNDPAIPFNAGLARPVSVLLPEASVVNAKFPAAFGVRFPTALRATDVTLGAMAQAAPGKMPAAGAGAMTPVLLSEPDFATGKRKVVTIQVLLGGTGGHPGGDGIDARNGEISTLRNTPVEVSEGVASIVVRRYGIRPDSGGPGYHRGGTGLVFEFQVRKPGSLLTARGLERYKFQPWGVNGGKAAANARTILNPDTPDEKDVGRIDALSLKPGDVVRFLTAGGGGWGDPFTRQPERVLWDVLNGLVSAEAAARDYGVVIVDGQVDAEQTRQLRAARQTNGRPEGFDFGPAREAYEQVWSTDLRDALAELLYSLPIDARDYVRVELVTELDRRAAQGGKVGRTDLEDAWRTLQQRFSMD
jgi:N-methylhydantoinase B